MFHRIKWQHTFLDSNIVPASNDGTMKYNFSLCSKESITLTCRVKQRSLRTSERQPQQDFIMPPNIRLHRHQHCPNTYKIFCLTSSVLNHRNCTVCQTMFMMQGISLLITPATIWSPIYPNLWMCLVRQWPVHIPDTDFNLVLFSCCPGKGTSCKHVHTQTLFCPISTSRFSCAMFWSSFVTKGCKQSQSSFELMWKKWSP